jgi:hypothetical protein
MWRNSRAGGFGRLGILTGGDKNCAEAGPGCEAGIRYAAHESRAGVIFQEE